MAEIPQLPKYWAERLAEAERIMGDVNMERMQLKADLAAAEKIINRYIPKIEKVEQLKADLATMGQKFTQYYDAFFKVKDDFNKFGGHTADCIRARTGNPNAKCDCGFAELQEKFQTDPK